MRRRKINSSERGIPCNADDDDITMEQQKNKRRRKINSSERSTPYDTGKQTVQVQSIPDNGLRGKQ